MPDDKDWFVGERSEAIANVLLRGQPDVEVEEFRGPKDYGVDFWVKLENGDSFAVQVKGSISPESSNWREGWNAAIHRFSQGPNMPLCFFLINVRTREAKYAWLAAPVIHSDGWPALQFKKDAEFKELNPDVVGEIIREVRAWYRKASSGFHVLPPA